ncbi:hypothetical protein MAR_021387 [Mya arenaria]|uniref:Uncharacterized protein n=1 Tax=Mya arenaria TaxID=6604 RepID=A0ABY7E7I2_MYAAR|nr:hypothetical protein MAR_021387 [Mya arenaria]
MEWSADIGSYNGTAQIRWLKNNIVAGSPLTPYYSSETVLGDPRATSNCVYQATDSVTYNITSQDAFRTADIRLHFQCYVYIPGSMDWENQHSEGDSSADDTDGVNKDIRSTGTVTIEVFGGAVGGVVALAVVITAPTYDHLTSREQTEYTDIGMTAVGNSGAGSLQNQSTSYERLHTREKAVYTELGSAFPESKTQYVNQQTDPPAEGSNYEVPENQESSNEQRDYENETNPKKTQASTYEHVYTAPLGHQYTALGMYMSIVNWIKVVSITVKKCQ